MTMKYNFDKIPNRRGTNSLKWDVDRKELPMWVLALRHRLVCVEQEIAGDHLEHSIAKEFQTLIAARLIPVLFICVGTVGQGVSQKSWIPELVTDHFLKFFKFFFHD